MQFAYTLTGENRSYDLKYGTLDRFYYGKSGPYSNAYWIRDDDKYLHCGSGAWEIAARYDYVDLNDGEDAVITRAEDCHKAIVQLLDIALDRVEAGCSCGSGLEKSAEYDARGIFLTYVCDDCRSAKLSRYRPDVLSDPDYWHDEPIDDDEEC